MHLVQSAMSWFRHPFFLICGAALASAQPSGGPYGPIDQRYEVPKAAHVYFVAPMEKLNLLVCR